MDTLNPNAQGSADQSFDLDSFVSEAKVYGRKIYEDVKTSPPIAVTEQFKVEQQTYEDGTVGHAIRHELPKGTVYHPLRKGVPTDLPAYRLVMLRAITAWPERNIEVGKIAYAAIQ